MADAEVKIEGMSCQHCVGAVKKAVDGLDGVSSSDVIIGNAKVSFDDLKLSKSDIEKVIVNAGYKIAG